MYHKQEASTTNAAISTEMPYAIANLAVIKTTGTTKSLKLALPVHVLDNPDIKSANNEIFVLADQNPGEQDTPISKFTGTENPRHVRAILALMRRPMLRESLDKEAGCSNGPELVAELRRRGLETPCKRIKFIDRDGKVCRPGVYRFTDSDRNKVNRWMATRQTGHTDLRLAYWLGLAAMCLLLSPGAY